MKIPTKKTSGILLFLSVAIVSNVSCANDNDGKETVTTAAEVTDQISHGETIHKNHCYKCHSDDVYTRDDRFVRSIDALSKQVERCKNGSNIPWFDEDTDAVTQFLNKKYYKF